MINAISENIIVSSPFLMDSTSYFFTNITSFDDSSLYISDLAMYNEFYSNEPVLCDKCSKNMISDDGSERAIAITITKPVYYTNYPEFYKKQFGKYNPDKTYNICYECFLDSLFGIKNVT